MDVHGTMSKDKHLETASGYKTEEQLKQEAKRRAEEQAKLDALKPPPSPQKKKADNFWYHYKWHTIAAAVVVALAVFFVRDVVLSTDPDATILFVTNTPVSQETQDALQAILVEQGIDGNGDGEVSILVDYIYTPPALPEGAEAQDDPSAAMAAGADYAGSMKLTTVVAAGVDLLYLLDDGMVAHFETMALSSEVDGDGNVIREEPRGDEILQIFEALDIPGAQGALLPVSATILADYPACEPLMDMYFALRPVMDEKKPEPHDYGLALLEALTNR